MYIHHSCGHATRMPTYCAVSQIKSYASDCIIPKVCVMETSKIEGEPSLSFVEIALL